MLIYNCKEESIWVIKNKTKKPMRNSEIGDYEEVRINTLTQSIYDKDNLYGILKLLDRFIDTVGKKRAIEIMEEFVNEGN